MEIQVRPAGPKDREPLMSFIKDVWGGHDYIPHVWDDWLKDKQAKMFVVTADGTPVGMNRMRTLQDGSVWLEGARVHPDYRGLGLASRLGENAVRIGRELGANVFRLTSGSWNRPAHRQVARMGFGEIARISVYEAPRGKRFPPQRAPRTASPRDLEAAMEAIMTSREYRLGAGVVWDGFAATKLTENVVGRLIGEKAVYLADGAVAIAKLGGEGRAVWRQVGFLGGSAEGAKSLVKHIFGKKEKKRTDRSLAYMVQGSRLIASMKDIGLERRWPLALFERRTSE